jgi:hypothetical protein
LFGFSNALFINPNTFLGFIRDCWRVMKITKAQRPSSIIDYERCSSATGFYGLLLSWASGCRLVSFGVDRSLTSTKLTVHDINDLTLEQMFLSGIMQMNKFEVPYRKFKISIDPKKVIININASDFLPARRYPIQHFTSLIKSLHDYDPECKFILTGSAGELEYVQQLISKLDDMPVVNTAGKWNLTQLVEELSECGLFITGDSGPVHLAAYLEIPTIALWGPTQAHHFGYIETDNLHSISLHLRCSPCFQHPASRPMIACHGKVDCMNNLDPTVVANRAISILRDLKELRIINLPSGMKSKDQIKPTLQLVLPT